MRSRTAASSIANGIPSRRRASSTTAAWLSGVTSNAAPASRARSMSKAMASDWAIRSGAICPSASGTESGPTWITVSPATAERLPAGGEDPQRRRLTEKRVGEHRTGVEQVLTVVEDEQQPLGGDVLDQPGHGPPARLIAKTERGHDRLGDELWIPQAGELHQPHAIRRSRASGRSPTEAPSASYRPHPDRRGSPCARCVRADLTSWSWSTSADEACLLRRHVPPCRGGAAGHGYPLRVT